MFMLRKRPRRSAQISSHFRLVAGSSPLGEKSATEIAQHPLPLRRDSTVNAVCVFDRETKGGIPCCKSRSTCFPVAPTLFGS
jgi:hypothetical protein